MLDDKNQVINLESIIALVPGNVYWKDKDGFFLGCNDNVAQILNLPSREHIIGKTNYDLMDKELADLATENDGKVLVTGKEITLEEKGFNIKGKPAIYLTTKKPLFNSKGKVVGLLGISIDITDKKRAEQLEKDKKIAHTTIEHLRATGASIAHQLGNPLAILALTSQRIQQALKSLSHHDHKRVNGTQKNTSNTHILQIKPMLLSYEIIQQQVDKINYVIDHHLVNINESRWSTQWGMMSLSPIPVSEIIEMALQQYPFDDEQQRANIHWQKNPDFQVMGEEQLFVHVILNLIENAFWSIQQANGGKISITTECNSDFNCVHIEDTGKGLSKEGRKHIFDPFYTTKKFQGTGLGLYFCRSVMQTYHGKITCRGRKGQYAQFSLHFPHTQQFLRFERSHIYRHDDI